MLLVGVAVGLKIGEYEGSLDELGDCDEVGENEMAKSEDRGVKEEGHDVHIKWVLACVVRAAWAALLRSTLGARSGGSMPCITASGSFSGM